MRYHGRRFFSARAPAPLPLQYFYDRNKNATSARSKQEFAIRISDIRKELKASHGLTQQQVVGNLNYLMSQGWIAEAQVLTE